MVKTGRDLGIFGGSLALIIGYLILSALSIAGVGEETDIDKEAFRGILVLLLGVASLLGGILGITGGVLAVRNPKAAEIVMLFGAGLTFISGFGIPAGVVLLFAGLQAQQFSKAPPGTEPEWQDGESLPY